jgi:zinc transport system ATP-binding protein
VSGSSLNRLAVELDGVEFAYTRGRPVLRDVDLRVAEGEFVAIAGPNGGGKTTLLRLALGLEQPTRGRVLLFGEPAASFRDRARIGYLAQRTRIGVHAPATVHEVVAAGRAPLHPYGRLRREDRAAVAEAIERVGLADRARRPLHELSGGQQQRALIAKALAARPSLLVLDEPTTGVDVGAQSALADLLEELRRELGVAILYVSHEFGAVEHVVQRIVLVRERIVFDGAPGDLPGMWHDPSHDHTHA